jgi:hypothetical protein
MDACDTLPPDNGWRIGLIAFGTVLFILFVTGLPSDWGFLLTGCAIFMLWILGVVRLVSHFSRRRRGQCPPDPP